MRRSASELTPVITTYELSSSEHFKTNNFHIDSYKNVVVDAKHCTFPDAKNMPHDLGSRIRMAAPENLCAASQVSHDKIRCDETKTASDTYVPLDYTACYARGEPDLLDPF